MFLLDSKHANARRRYKANLASEQTPMAQEERMERNMSTRRKMMREELITRKHMAARMMGETSATSDGGFRQFDVDWLQREGERLHAKYSARKVDRDAAR